MEERTAIDILFDENSNENFFLYDENDERHEFEQHAVIPFEGEVYAIVRPVVPFEGMDEDEGMVFRIDEENEELVEITDSDLIEKLFEEYDKL
ncbi:DUF1292 domain-containing protein [bacterium]|nr:DUF1292 domain-containing protein [bacterium]